MTELVICAIAVFCLAKLGDDGAAATDTELEATDGYFLGISCLGATVRDFDPICKDAVLAAIGVSAVTTDLADAVTGSDTGGVFAVFGAVTGAVTGDGTGDGTGEGTCEGTVDETGDGTGDETGEGTGALTGAEMIIETRAGNSDVAWLGVSE